MPREAPIYDLTLLLDPQAPEAARDKALADAEQAIEAGGTLVGHHDWGDRRLAYEIRHRADAHYHLLQFTPNSKELLSSLDRSLRIADGVLRHRIIKLAPGTPPPPEMKPEPRPAAEPAAGDAAPQASEPAAAEAPAASEADATPAASEAAGESAQ